MVNGVLMHVVEPGELRLLEGQFRIPELIDYFSPGSGIQSVEPDGEFAVEVAQENPMGCGGILEIDYEVIVVDQKGPGMKAQAVISSEAESRRAK
jgi:hypothetical protein